MMFMQAKKKDKAEILSLYQSVIGSEGCTWSDDYPNEEILEDDYARNAIFVLKDEAGEIAGAVSIDADKIVDALDCWSKTLRPAAELARLAVRKKDQNKGTARHIISEAMKELKTRGYRSVHFLVSKTNERALRSYAKLDFEKKGEADLYGEHWWCYEKELAGES